MRRDRDSRARQRPVALHPCQSWAQRQQSRARAAGGQARARGGAPVDERQAALLAHDAGARLRLVGRQPGGALRVRAVRRVHRARHRRAEADARARQRRFLCARAACYRLLLPKPTPRP